MGYPNYPKYGRHYTSVNSLMAILHDYAIWSTRKTGTFGDLGDGVYFTELFAPLTPELGFEDSLRELAMKTNKVTRPDDFDISIFEAFIDVDIEFLIDLLGKDYLEYRPNEVFHQLCISLPVDKDELSLSGVPFLVGKFIPFSVRRTRRISK